MPIWKRIFDLAVLMVLCILTAPVFVAIILWMLLKKELPVFYIAERMKTPTEPFQLIKFRTMRPATVSETNTGVSGGDKANRITSIGKVLRDIRLDELPQLWNVLKGEISFVGPRPPLRRYTDLFPELYGKVLSNRPGLTGLASILFHKTEARLLATATTPAETEMIYIEKCIPRKARLDAIYSRKQSLSLDLYILYLTAAKIIPLPGRRAKRVR